MMGNLFTSPRDSVARLSRTSGSLRLSYGSLKSPSSHPCKPTVHSSNLMPNRQLQTSSGHKSNRPFITAAGEQSKTTERQDLAWDRLMEECEELQKDLEGEWEEAAVTMATRREEYVQALSQYEEQQNLGPWKTNTKYRQQKQEIRRKLKDIPDPTGDRDKEIVLRVACPISSAAIKQNYVSLADMTPGRLHFLTKAGRRGFGQTSVSPDVIISNIDKLRSPHLYLGSNSSSDLVQLHTEPAPSHQRMDTLSSQQTRSSTSPINEFILKERGKYLRAPVSRTLLARKMTMAAAIEKIQSSPDIVKKVERIEKARSRRRKYLRARTYKPMQGHEEELKEEILQYRMDAKQEMAMDKRVRKSILIAQGKGDRRKSGFERFLG